MQLVTIPEQRVLSVSRSLTLLQGGAFVVRAIDELEARADLHQIAFAGPWTFVSHNLPQDTTTEFTLMVCRPVAEASPAGDRIGVVTLPALTAVTREYEGPLSGIYAGGYAPLLEAVLVAGIPPTGEIREVHHVRDTPESPINQVEIQIGLVAEPPD